MYEYFARWQRDGTRGRPNAARVARAREAEWRTDPTPSAACLDSQSVKGTEATGNPGYDGGTKGEGGKRPILTATPGLLLAVIFADQKYHNHAFEKWRADERPGVRLEIHSRPAGAVGFTPLRKRWVVERTFAWLGRCRRNGRDRERTVGSAEAMAEVSSIG